MPEYSVGVTTAPRGCDYLQQTLDGLKRTGFPEITVFAEPGSKIPPNYPVCENTETFGCFQNWLSALRILSEKPSPTVILCQDDVLFASGIRKLLDRLVWPPKCGVISLYTAAKDAHGETLGEIRHIRPWGGLAYVFPRDIARRIVRDAVSWKWESSKKVDLFVGRMIINRLVRKFYSFSPSLAQHAGEVSTLKKTSGTSGSLSAIDFVGEDFDADSLCRDVVPA